MTSQGVEIQRLADDVNNKPIYACMWLDGQTQLVNDNFTDMEEGEQSFEGLLIVKDEHGNIIMHRHGFGCIIEDGAGFDENGEFVITDQSKVDVWWNEFTTEIQNRGLIMP